MIVDIVSDFVCPWCYIGKRNLDALRGEMPVETRWHPYLLHPDMPAGGIERGAFMRAKFGDDSERLRGMSATIEQAAREAGLFIEMGKIARIPDTRDAHRLMRWATGQGVADALAERLFAAHFADGRDIGDRAVLAELAGEVGLDPALVAELLEGDAERAFVDTASDQARAAGINGVPAIMLAADAAQREQVSDWSRRTGTVAGQWFFVERKSA